MGFSLSIPLSLSFCTSLRPCLLSFTLFSVSLVCASVFQLPSLLFINFCPQVCSVCDIKTRMLLCHAPWEVYIYSPEMGGTTTDKQTMKIPLSSSLVNSRVSTVIYRSIEDTGGPSQRAYPSMGDDSEEQYLWRILCSIETTLPLQSLFPLSICGWKGLAYVFVGPLGLQSPLC